jgi:hypothetical protein
VRLSDAIRTAPPVRDLGLIDLVALVVSYLKTRCRADRAVDVHHPAAQSTDQMVVVVANAILEASGCPGGLNAPEESFGDQDGESVVHRLERDRTDLTPHNPGHLVGRTVRPPRHRAKDRQSLGRDLNPALTKEISRIAYQGPTA